MSKKIKISWFSSDTPMETVLSSNGRVLDNYCIKCETTEKGNDYISDMSFLIDDDIVELMEEESILKLRLDYGFEIFTINKVDKGLRSIDILAEQITKTKSKHLYLDDVRPTSLNGQGYMSYLLDNSILDSKDSSKELFLESDIQKVSTSYFEDMSLHDSLFNCDQSFTSRLGGEVQRRGYTLSINSIIGVDRGVTIREGKNLTGFTGSSNVDSLVTVARGKGFNGIKGNWIKSGIADNYHYTYRKTIEYQDVKVKDENSNEGYDTLALAQAELDRRIKEEFKNGIDTIKATYNINFVQLEKTLEYKNYIQAEKTYIGDYVRVYIPKIKEDIKLRVIGKKFDVLSQKVKEITISNVSESSPIGINSIIMDLKKEYNKTGNSGISSYIDAIIKAGMQDSYLVVRENELLVMDDKDLNKATKVTRLNKMGLGFSSTGYYGKYVYGFTLDGKINASLIATGVLTAIVIKSNDGSCSINLDTGVVNFTKGIIKGLNSSWDLDTGIFSSKGKNVAGEITEIILKNGGMYSNEYLEILATKGVSIGFNGGNNVDFGILSTAVWGAYIGGKKINIVSGSDGIKLISGVGGTGRIDIDGEVYINGVKLDPLATPIT